MVCIRHCGRKPLEVKKALQTQAKCSFIRNSTCLILRERDSQIDGQHIPESLGMVIYSTDFLLLTRSLPTPRFSSPTKDLKSTIRILACDRRIGVS